MYKLAGGVIIFLLLLVSKTEAQSTMSFKTIDSISYNYYQKQNWDSLIYLKNQLDGSEVDYFYLRMRFGIAYFEKNKFNKSTEEFKKALEFNALDSLAKEYLYYSYLYNVKEGEAKLVEPERLRKKQIIDAVYVELGPTFSNNNKTNQTAIIDNSQGIYEQIDLSKDETYLHLGLKHQLTKRISVYHGYSNIGINRTKQMLINGSVVTDNYYLKQQDYYINVNWYLGKGFSVTPFFHYLYVDYEKLNAYEELPVGSDHYSFYKTTTTLKDYVVGLSIDKRMGIFNLNLNGMYSSINYTTGTQLGLALTYYPFGNTNFWGSTSITKAGYKSPSFSTQKGIGGPPLVFGQSLGVSLFKKAWIEGNYTLGTLANFSENNAFVVYNSTDKIVNKWNISLTIPINKKIEAKLGYSFYNYQSSYMSCDTEETFTIKPTKYENQSIIGGIKWKL
ncbi:MAG: hypothetical protein HXX09_07880 [Bacteroidetes bacterium]|nr:hypothetical protein [Bacteroidota bacterium]